VEAIVSDAAPSNLDEVVDQALLGDLPAVETSLTRFFHEGGEADHLMMRLVARLLLLHRIRLEMDQGRQFDAACQVLFVKLPLTARRALARQAERWTSESIAQRLPAVRVASARVRGDSRLAEVLATRALWTLASRARVARR
jgi:DNA polymerase-3 subunit delta